jgi:hypothetical protein
MAKVVTRTTTFDSIASQTGRVIFDSAELELWKTFQPVVDSGESTGEGCDLRGMLDGEVEFPPQELVEQCASIASQVDA